MTLFVENGDDRYVGHAVAAAVQCRTDIPMDTVPELRVFKRHLWKFRDEYGMTPISPPPSMFSACVSGSEGGTIVREHAASLLLLEGHDRLSITEQDGEYAVSFHDIEVLHRFISDVIARSRHDKDDQSRVEARSVAESFLWLLGYRWT